MEVWIQKKGNSFNLNSEIWGMDSKQKFRELSHKKYYKRLKQIEEMD